MDILKQMVMGTAITRDYEVSKSLKATSSLWKIYSATKRNSPQTVSVFIFERKSSDSISGFVNNTSSKEIEKISDILKKEASQLARLRHPSLLKVVETFEETRLMLTFAAEPIQICLANLLSHDLPVGTDYDLDVLEIQKGLLQIAKALQFCHNDAKLVHGNLCPNALFVTPKGDWKLGGFGFCTYILYNNEDTKPLAYYEYDTKLPSSCQQNLDYLAPEFIIDQQLDYPGDMFSLGCLIYSIFNPGKTLLKTRNNILAYRSQIEKLNSLSLDNTPSFFEGLVRDLTKRNYQSRPTAVSFQESPAFNNVLVKTMRFLENIVEHPQDNKVQFLQGLIRVLPQFPEKLLIRKILPALLEVTKDSELLPFSLPNLMFIVNKLTIREFSELVMPDLKQAFSIKGPSQSLLSLLDCIEAIIPKASPEAFKNDVLPCVYSSLESKDANLQDRALKVIPTFADQLDYTLVKNSLYTRIQGLYTRTNLLSIKVGTLMCFHALLKVLDKFTMVEKLIPLLQNTKSKDPGVQLAILGIYQEMGMNHAELDVIACQIIPELWKASVNPLLNLNQFRQLMSSITLLSQKVQKEQMEKLEALSKLEQRSQETERLKNGPEKTHTGMGFEQLINGSLTAHSIGKQNSSISMTQSVSVDKLSDDSEDNWSWSEFAKGNKETGSPIKISNSNSPIRPTHTNVNRDSNWNKSTTNTNTTINKFATSSSSNFVSAAPPKLVSPPRIPPPNNQSKQSPTSFSLNSKQSFPTSSTPTTFPQNLNSSSFSSFSQQNTADQNLRFGSTSNILTGTSKIGLQSASPSSNISTNVLKPTSASTPMNLKKSTNKPNKDWDMFDPLA